MNKKLLLSLQKRNKARLTELRTKLENGEVREEEVESVQTEVDELTEEAQEIADQLAEIEDEGDEERDGGDDKGEDGKKKKDDEEDDEKEEDEDEGESRSKGLSPEQRNNIVSQIGKGLSTRGNKSSKKKEKEIRSAFANFVAGKISESEARSLGIETGNGSVTVPEVIASEVISYAQEENLLRKYGSTHKTKGDVKYPVLVKKADANVNKKERAAGNPIAETTIEFDEILLSPAEFDALATVTQKLLNMSGAPVETIVIDELKKAYVRKETNYMFNGDGVDNENPGALAKKAVAYYESAPVDITAAGYSQKLYSQLVKLKGQPVTEVLKKSMWIVNRAALTVLEDMTDTTGRPLLHAAADGVGYKLLGHKLDFTDAADGSDSTKPVFYFGDFKAFHIQDVIGGMQLQKLVETYANTNRVGFKIYNLLDGQLVYSPFEPAVYRYEVGEVDPNAGV
jgi:HK97 family phage major capsid protein